MTETHSICVTGGTGYIGRRLIPLLTHRGHVVKAVVRAGSQNKLPGNVSVVIADPLKADSYTESIRGCDTFIHLIGVPHPSPAKAAQFRAIDLPSIQIAVKAARDAGIRHFIYLSVGAASLDDAGLHCGARGRRGAHSRERDEGDLRAPVVRARSRPSLGLRAAAVLLDRGIVAGNARIGAASRTRHDLADA